jgi:rhodanese-related sulfurtransferase
MRKLVVGFLFGCALISAALFSPYSAFAAVVRITAEDLNKKLCSPNLLLLDLRNSDLWEKSKIKMKCSRRVDPDDVSSWIDTLPRDKEIVLYCCS